MTLDKLGKVIVPGASESAERYAVNVGHELRSNRLVASDVGSYRSSTMICRMQWKDRKDHITETIGDIGSVNVTPSRLQLQQVFAPVRRSIGSGYWHEWYVLQMSGKVCGIICDGQHFMFPL